MSGAPEQPPQMICGQCDLPLSLGKVAISYLGNSFEVELLRCPGCGLSFVPEELALGKMLKVEQALEEK
jgi:hypothetical protein